MKCPRDTSFIVECPRFCKSVIGSDKFTRVPTLSVCTLLMDLTSLKFNEKRFSFKVLQLNPTLNRKVVLQVLKPFNFSKLQQNPVNTLSSSNIDFLKLFLLANIQIDISWNVRKNQQNGSVLNKRKAPIYCCDLI